MSEPYCHYCAIGHPFQAGGNTQHILTLGGVKTTAPCRKQAVPSSVLPGGIVLERQGQTRHVFSSAPGGDHWGQAMAAAESLMGVRFQKVEFIAKKPKKRKPKVKAKALKKATKVKR